mmetsp:Transcript_26313/g.39006  ORF Transcript_26313/g.39006 Transcript_26313/m.39006 type:complete len:1263 (+) Transcript_26313:112-3900(+)|eukprot:CAMPEP_0185023340 /NCGR_PEP_ID=MMETSP1103-20130426/6024_1 /TAXON_ID=36769 /ORGANISM="Paraphysomonas bandaiensis, Strain Caron Lab Isolate" /LENGTH=1262 /DNA_ID=CAMNT_0027555895 /DNA_START=55 /DNA_END=3843 /DNA_ORIENTATION=+
MSSLIPELSRLLVRPGLSAISPLIIDDSCDNFILELSVSYPWVMNIFSVNGDEKYSLALKCGTVVDVNGVQASNRIITLECDSVRGVHLALYSRFEFDYIFAWSCCLNSSFGCIVSGCIRGSVTTATDNVLKFWQVTGDKLDLISSKPIPELSSNSIQSARLYDDYILICSSRKVYLFRCGKPSLYRDSNDNSAYKHQFQFLQSFECSGKGFIDSFIVEYDNDSVSTVVYPRLKSNFVVVVLVEERQMVVHMASPDPDSTATSPLWISSCLCSMALSVPAIACVLSRLPFGGEVTVGNDYHFQMLYIFSDSFIDSWIFPLWSVYTASHRAVDAISLDRVEDICTYEEYLLKSIRSFDINGAMLPSLASRCRFQSVSDIGSTLSFPKSDSRCRIYARPVCSMTQMCVPLFYDPCPASDAYSWEPLYETYGRRHLSAVYVIPQVSSGIYLSESLLSTFLVTIEKLMKFPNDCDMGRAILVAERLISLLENIHLHSLCTVKSKLISCHSSGHVDESSVRTIGKGMDPDVQALISRSERCVRLISDLRDSLVDVELQRRTENNHELTLTCISIVKSSIALTRLECPCVYSIFKRIYHWMVYLPCCPDSNLVLLYSWKLMKYICCTQVNVLKQSELDGSAHPFCINGMSVSTTSIDVVVTVVLGLYLSASALSESDQDWEKELLEFVCLTGIPWELCPVGLRILSHATKLEQRNLEKIRIYLGVYLSSVPDVLRVQMDQHCNFESSCSDSVDDVWDNETFCGYGAATLLDLVCRLCGHDIGLFHVLSNLDIAEYIDAGLEKSSESMNTSILVNDWCVCYGWITTLLRVCFDGSSSKISRLCGFIQYQVTNCDKDSYIHDLLLWGSALTSCDSVNRKLHILNGTQYRAIYPRDFSILVNFYIPPEKAIHFFLPLELNRICDDVSAVLNLLTDVDSSDTVKPNLNIALCGCNSFWFSSSCEKLVRYLHDYLQVSLSHARVFLYEDRDRISHSLHARQNNRPIEIPPCVIVVYMYSVFCNVYKQALDAYDGNVDSKSQSVSYSALSEVLHEVWRLLSGGSASESAPISTLCDLCTVMEAVDLFPLLECHEALSQFINSFEVMRFNVTRRGLGDTTAKHQSTILTIMAWWVRLISVCTGISDSQEFDGPTDRWKREARELFGLIFQTYSHSNAEYSTYIEVIICISKYICGFDSSGSAIGPRWSIVLAVIHDYRKSKSDTRFHDIADAVFIALLTFLTEHIANLKSFIEIYPRDIKECDELLHFLKLIPEK